jgi:hypothetical protein
MTLRLSLMVVLLLLHLLVRPRPHLSGTLLDNFIHVSSGFSTPCIFLSHRPLFRGLIKSLSHLQQRFLRLTYISAIHAYQQIYILGYALHTRIGSIFRVLQPVLHKDGILQHGCGILILLAWKTSPYVRR